MATNACGRMSHHARSAHDHFGLLADFARHFERIALRVLRQEELDRQRAGVSLARELAQNRLEWSNAVARNDPCGLLEQFPRHSWSVLEVHVPDLAGFD